MNICYCGTFFPFCPPFAPPTHKDLWTFMIGGICRLNLDLTKHLLTQWEMPNKCQNPFASGRLRRDHSRYYSLHDAFGGWKKGFENDCNGPTFHRIRISVAICHKFFCKMNRLGLGLIHKVRRRTFYWSLGLLFRFCGFWSERPEHPLNGTKKSFDVILIVTDSLHGPHSVRYRFLFTFFLFFRIKEGRKI